LTHDAEDVIPRGRLFQMFGK